MRLTPHVIMIETKKGVKDLFLNLFLTRLFQLFKNRYSSRFFGQMPVIEGAPWVSTSQSCPQQSTPSQWSAQVDLVSGLAQVRGMAQRAVEIRGEPQGKSFLPSITSGQVGHHPLLTMISDSSL